MINIKTRITWKQYNKSGILIPELTVEHEANTLVTAFWQNLCANFTNATVSVKDTGNAARGTPAGTPMVIKSNSGVTTYGIVVGTGTNAVAATDYALQTLIAHGLGAGKLQYAAQGCDTNVTTSGANTYFTATRRLDNGSGGTITIQEVGIYSWSGTYFFCLDRTLSEYAILNGNYAICTYKIGTS
jgi:hypothetical protein